MWSCDCPAGKPVLLQLTLDQKEESGKDSGISAVKLWNYNKSLGVRRSDTVNFTS